MYDDKLDVLTLLVLAVSNARMRSAGLGLADKDKERLSWHMIPADMIPKVQAEKLIALAKAIVLSLVPPFFKVLLRREIGNIFQLDLKQAC
jgi:hypothetical protein